MEALSPKPQASPATLGRRRGRKPGEPLTERELATRRANLAKARAVANRSYRRTEKRLDASRANLAKAQAARRTAQGNAVARLNALKHGLFAKDTLAESVDRLGEDKRECASFIRFVESVFPAASDDEKPIVRGLAETLWRRLRFFHAQARWERERLQKTFRVARPAPPSNLHDLVARADRLSLALIDFEAFYRELDKLESQVEYWLRKLIRKRSHGEINWRGSSPRRDPVIERMEREERENRFIENWTTLTREEQRALLDEVRKKTPPGRTQP